jgi:hypothetical protein
MDRGVSGLYRPEIDIRVIGQSGDVLLHALLDTGADEIVLPGSIADEIGAELDRSIRWQVAGFAGQSTSAILGRVEIELSDGIETYAWRAPVAVVSYDDTAEEQVALLGHRGFLDYFDAKFRGVEHEVVLTPCGFFPQR